MIAPSDRESINVDCTPGFEAKRERLSIVDEDYSSFSSFQSGQGKRKPTAMSLIDLYKRFSETRIHRTEVTHVLPCTVNGK